MIHEELHAYRHSAAHFRDRLIYAASTLEAPALEVVAVFAESLSRGAVPEVMKWIALAPELKSRAVTLIQGLEALYQLSASRERDPSLRHHAYRMAEAIRAAASHLYP